MGVVRIDKISVLDMEMQSASVLPVCAAEDAAIERELCDELGFDLSKTSDRIARLVKHYDKLLENAFRADDVLTKKIADLEAYAARLEAVAAIDETLPSSAALQAAIARHTEELRAARNIDADREALIANHAKVAKIRDAFAPVLGTVRESPACTICLKQSISHVLIPCGHLFCATCAKKQHNQCYVCRTTIKERHKVYFS